MVHPGLNFIKQINSDKFDPKTFIANHLEEFFKQLSLYIQSLYKFDKKKEVMSSTKRVNGLMIVNALGKILPNVKQSDFPNSSSKDVDTIFSFLLHPDTPSEIRTPSSSLFKEFAKKLDDNCLSQLDLSFYFLIPFSELARNDEERQNILKNYPKNVCGLCSNGNPISVEEAYSEVSSTFQFIIDLCLLNKAQTPSQFLYNDVFPTIYFNQIQSIGYQNKKQGGFDSPSPTRLHNEVLKFLITVRQSKCNLLPFGDTKEKIRVLLAILTDSGGPNQNDNAVITFQVMNIFTQEPLFGNFKIQNQLQPLIDLVFNLMKSFSTENAKKSSPKASIFLSNLLSSEFKSMNGEDLTLNMLSYLYQKATNEAQMIFVQESAVLFILNGKISNQKIWDLVLFQLKSSPIAAIATCRFSMYFATLIAPLFFKINVEETINACTNISLRSKRNRSSNDYDFVAEYIELICKDPTNFVSKCLELGFDHLSKCISVFKDYPFPEMRCVPTTIEGIKSLNDFFFPHFNFVQNPKMQLNDQYCMFSVSFVYYYTLFKLQLFPPEIKFDRSAFFFNYGNKLMEISLNLSLPPNIKVAVFSLLSESINNRSLSDSLNSSILTHWYMILYLYVLSSNEELSEIAFISAVRTLRIGFTGSVLLVPLLLYALENGLVTNLMNMKPEEKRDLTISRIGLRIGSVSKPDDSKSLLKNVMGNANNNLSKFLKDRNGDLANPTLSFLSMAPLFQHSIPVPQQFINYVKNAISSSSSLFDQRSSTIIDQLSTQKDNYKKDVLDCFNMFKNCCCVVTAASVLIVNEIVNDNPDIDFLNSLLDYYNEPIVKHHSIETLNCLMGMMNYFKVLNQICKESVLKLVTNLTNETVKITYEDQQDWIYSAISTLMPLLIHTYQVNKETDNAQRFCMFLAKFSSSPQVPPNIHENIYRLSQYSLDMMSVYYGSYPFLNSPLFPSNMSVTPEKENFYSIGNHTLIHASTSKNPEDESQKEIRIDIINEVGKFSYSFRSISNELIQEEPIQEIDIPVTSEKEESIKVEKQYIEEVVEPLKLVIEEYEKDERQGQELPIDLIDKNDREITKTIEDIEESKNSVKTGKLDKVQIRPFTKINDKVTSAFTPLSILNYVTFENKSKVKRIENTKASKVLLDKIENHGHRIRTKIGLVYVGLHKDDQDMIFSTKLEETSVQFREFLVGLGYPVDLSTHCLYNGGLDLKGERSGKTSIYYADFNNEVMFHVGPLLPTSTSDSQQVLKKRHIGNDHVYIIYVDNDHDYNPSTISSQFGMMQLIVYPIKNSGLYRVEVYSRENDVPYFAPLRNGTIVQKKALPSLVRATAIVTMMNIWCHQKEYFHPTIELASLIDELCSKHTIDDGDNNYLSIDELMSVRNE